MKKIIISFAAATLLATSCTGNFEEINTSLTGVTEQQMLYDNTLVGASFIPLQKVIYYNVYGWDFQLYQNLNADLFSGYMSTVTFFAGNQSNQTYVMNPGWNDWCWNMHYQHVMPLQLRNYEACMKYGFGETPLTKEEIASKNWKESSFAHFIAVNNILRVMGMSRLADQYGPIIYSKWGKSAPGQPVEYDSMKELYDTFFAELKEAVEVLDKTLTAKGPETSNFGRFDMIYGGNLEKWVKLANTLRLRLAMRMVKVDPAGAKTQGEAAIAAPRGLMTKSDDSFVLAGNNWKNPLYTLSIAWVDAVVSANVESILGGYGDSRLAKFAIPIDGKVTGARLGLANQSTKLDEKGKPKEITKDDYVGNGTDKPQLVSKLNITSDSDASVVVYNTETYFLLAEAALRGWNTGGGSAQSFYEAGVRASFEYWSAPMGDYLSSNNTPSAWVDPFKDNGGKNDIAAASKITPRWDESASDEVKLEKIITQKWIAGFPEGMNAWAEYRRTGYPKLFPVAENNSGGTISTELGPRRLPYTVEEYNLNKAGVEGAAVKLGGKDNAATRLWWDVDKANF